MLRNKVDNLNNKINKENTEPTSDRDIHSDKQIRRIGRIKKEKNKKQKNPQLDKLDSLKNKVDNLNNKVNKRFTNPITVVTTNLKSEINELKRKNKFLIHKNAKPDKVLEADLTKSYLTDLDFDKTVFNLLKIVYDNLNQEFSQLDKINKNLYGCENSLLNVEGYIKITKKNFALIVKKAYLINSNDKFNYDVKINNLYDFSYKTLISQNKLLQVNPMSELRHLNPRNIDSILNKIIMKTEDNVSQFKEESKEKIKVLVFEILQNLPLILL